MTSPSIRLVLCLDGTNNTPKDRTNVYRIFRLIAPNDKAGIPQKAHYLRGIGTEFGSYVSGNIFGNGTAEKIREGYRWLAENHVDGAEIYLFGFSRGAFAARSLIQMIANVGLSRPDNLKDFDENAAFARYEAISRQETLETIPLYKLRYWKNHPTEAPKGWVANPTETMLLEDSRVAATKIKFAGLWDTVGALGMDTITGMDVKTQKARRHNVRPTRMLENGYHAVAIDEHRKPFDITLWRTYLPDDKRIEDDPHYADHFEQCWFPGAHSDVGGGYDDDEDRLPDITLEWMQGKAAALGLGFTHRVEPRPDAHHGKIHDSFTSFAAGLLAFADKLKPDDQRNYRVIKKAAVPTLAGETKGALHTLNETIHESALKRWREDSNYRPLSLVAFFKNHPQLLPHGTSLGQRTRRIYANRYWNETGVFVRSNVRYRITVVPDVGEPLWDADYQSRSIEGEDWNSAAHNTAAMLHGKRMDGAKWFALIGTVDKRHPAVLRDSGEVIFPEGGQLICYFNDVELEWFYGNNAGWVVLQIDEC